MYEHIEQLIAEVAREVAAPDNGGPLRLLRAGRVYRAAPGEVWDAMTDAVRIGQWLAPVSGDLRPGGTFRLHGAASGIIESCGPGPRLTATWDNAGETGRLSLLLAREDAGVRLVLEHAAEADPDRWRKFGPGVIGVGWDLALLGLSRHLAASDARQPEDWIFSDEGRTFVRQSASAWGEAAAAAGEDRLTALEAAARAAQVYAGEGADSG